MYLNQISLQTIKIHFPKTFGQEYKGNLCIFLWKVTFSGSRKILKIFRWCKEQNRSMSDWESIVIHITPPTWIPTWLPTWLPTWRPHRSTKSKRNFLGLQGLKILHFTLWVEWYHCWQMIFPILQSDFSNILILKLEYSNFKIRIF